jgi:hypothetical protein
MDEEEFAFLNDQKQLRRKREAQKAAAERESLTAFAIARANLTVKKQSTTTLLSSAQSSGSVTKPQPQSKPSTAASATRRVGVLPPKGTATVLVRKRKLGDAVKEPPAETESGAATAKGDANKPGLSLLMGYGSDADDDDSDSDSDDDEDEDDDDDDGGTDQQTQSAAKRAISSAKKPKR